MVEGNDLGSARESFDNGLAFRIVRRYRSVCGRILVRDPEISLLDVGHEVRLLEAAGLEAGLGIKCADVIQSDFLLFGR